jgi:hypothetical protein
MRGIQVAGGTNRTDEQRELQSQFPALIGMCKRGLCAVGPEWCYLRPGANKVLVKIPTPMAERFFANL